MMLSYNQKINAVQKQIDQTKAIMTHNVDALIIRGEKINRLVDLTHTLEQRSEIFAHNARKLKWTLYFRDFSVQAILVGVGSGILYGLISGQGWGGILFQAVLGGLIGYQIGKISLLGGLYMLTGAKHKKEKTKTNKETLEEQLAAQQAREKKELKKRQAQVDKAKETIKEAIDEVILRGENLESLQKKTAQLEEGSKIFKKTSRKIEISAWARTLSIGLNLLGLIVGIAYALWHEYSLPMVLGSGLLGCGMMFSLGQLVSYLKPVIEATAWYEGLENPFKGALEYVQDKETNAAVILEEAKDYLPGFNAALPPSLSRSHDPLENSLDKKPGSTKPH